MATTQRVRCWGANDSGQLGLGHLGDRDTPSQLVLSARRGWTLSAGTQHTCVLEDDATGTDDLFCFGANVDLRVAAGAPDATMPVRIAGGEWRGVAAGGDHTCARGPRGDLWCWGANDEGQLGRTVSASEDRARTCL
jgi:alpha-tubulin suppressor-like RCC1 family protein